MVGTTSNHFNHLILQEEDITKLVECMALNSADTSEEEESEVSEASYDIVEDDKVIKMMDSDVVFLDREDVMKNKFLVIAG
jgi:hypothetical protein